MSENEESTIDQTVRAFWKEWLAQIDENVLVATFGQSELDFIIKHVYNPGLNVEHLLGWVVEPFADELESGTYVVYLEEVRKYVRSDEEIDTTPIRSLVDIDHEIAKHELNLQHWRKIRAARVDRGFYLLGQKPPVAKLSKIELQDELYEKYGARDTEGFRALLKNGDIEKAKKWLQGVIDNKERLFYYHDGWDRWLGHRRDELARASRPE